MSLRCLKAHFEHFRRPLQVPPHCVEIAKTQRGGVYPSSTCQKWDKDTTERRHAPPCHVKRGMTRQGGAYTPPHYVETIKTQWGGAYPSLMCRKWDKDTMGRGHAPPHHVKRGTTRQGGVYAPPHRVKTAKTQRGGAQPSLLRQKMRKMKDTYHTIGGGHDSPSPALVIPPLRVFHHVVHLVVCRWSACCVIDCETNKTNSKVNFEWAS